MRTVEMSAPAKVNITLRVLGKREDGYHDIETIFQAIGLYDVVTIRETAGERNLDVPGFPELAGPGNLVWRALEAMERELGHELPVRIELNKRIPIAAGLGGGSSDAAAALAGLRELFAPDLPDERLRLSAAGLGADVPFFLAGGTAVGEGIGDRLTQVRLAHSKSIFLVNPGFPVETARVYREFSKSLTRRRTGAILTELKVGRRDPETLLENDLQGACERLYPAVTALIGRCEAECGAKALMSGSGPTVFCFLNRADADEALHAFRDMAAFVAEPISTGVTAH